MAVCRRVTLIVGHQRQRKSRAQDQQRGSGPFGHSSPGPAAATAGVRLRCSWLPDLGDLDVPGQAERFAAS